MTHGLKRIGFALLWPFWVAATPLIIMLIGLHEALAALDADWKPWAEIKT